MVTANDTFTTVSDTLTITINENHPPEKPSTFKHVFNISEGIAGTHTLVAFTDAENDPITYAMTNQDGSALDSTWISFDSTTRQVTYNATSSLTSPTFLKLIVSDPYNDPVTATLRVNINFAPINNTSVIQRTGEFLALNPQTTQIDKDVLLDDGGISTYTVTFANGSATPAWLTVRPPSSSPSGNWEFSGTYPTYEQVLLEFVITGTDSQGLTGTANFYIDIVGKSNLFLTHSVP